MESVRSSFELLPDEMILNVYQYLRVADVLYSFYNLNTRLNRTIRDRCVDVNLMNLSHQIFSYCVSNVLPSIGTLIQSFVLNGNWETIISKRLFSILFETRLSRLCPNLEKLILRWFTCDRVLSLMDNLEECEYLTELHIQYLRGDPSPSLLKRLLSANNNRLSIVLFDEDSSDLTLSEENERPTFPNIQQLSVNLTQSEDLGRLFCMIPNVRRLSVSIEEWSDGRRTKSPLRNVCHLPHLRVFQLRSINLFWTYDDIAPLFKSMPSLERLSLDIRTDDYCLFEENSLREILPESVIDLNYFIRYYPFEHALSLMNSSNFDAVLFPVAHLPDEPRHRFIVHTIPCNLRSMIIPTSVAKAMLPGWKYMQSVEDLCISDAADVDDILLILQHFRRIRTLTITPNDKAHVLKPSSTATASISLRLPCLKQIDLSGKFALYPLLIAAPRLDYLIIPYDVLEELLSDPLACDLLRHRIVRLSISDWTDVKSNILPRLADVFRSLRHLVITLKNPTDIIDDFVVNLLSLWRSNQRLSLDVKGKLSDDIKKNLRSWIINQSHLTGDDSFATECTEKWFDLWH